ncbi:MAG: transglutaminase domain-containing protein [Oscillospiraceae bacterium]|nr:transglutaminase domain-containing protein [Oscillospiraceae bacterium]
MKKRSISLLLFISIFVLLLPSVNAVTQDEEAPLVPSFDVKAEIAIITGGTMLFSEKPIRVQWGNNEAFVEHYSIAYVFPLGTQIAYRNEHSLEPIGIYVDARWGGFAVQHTPGTLIYEMELTSYEGSIEFGVRVRTEDSRSLLSILVEGETRRALEPGISTIYVWNIDPSAPRPTSEAALDFYREPSKYCRSDYQEIIELANSITEGINDDYEMAKAIHTWVAENIWYDNDRNYEAEIFVNPQADEEEFSAIYVLEHRRGVCSGFANLTISLLRAAGIPAMYVKGRAKDNNGLSAGHAWYEAYVGGRWIRCDSTWDSQNIIENGVSSPQRNSSNEWFNVNNVVFARNHLPLASAEFILQNNLAATELVTHAPDLVSADSWARPEIRDAYYKGFVPTQIQRNYSNVISRQEFCILAVRYIEYITGESYKTLLADMGKSIDYNTFDDTENEYILAAYTLGITTGTRAPTESRPGSFTPTGWFSREEAATMLVRICMLLEMNIIESDDVGYIDIGNAAPWAVDSINTCYTNGLMTGTSIDPLRFNPKARFTRQESIAVLNRMG